ncbi:MAG: M3 family metallopeptidase [Bacteroidales bacterium]|jgi:peptidyl-dipeptidase Dcp|nr:M3 family metallopeptidase [Bacteroidales bacterium]
MRKTTILLIGAAAMLMTACNCDKKNSASSDNPFFTEYTTPHQVPPFDKIQDAHYMPAFVEGMKQHKAEIDAIIANTEEPTFENTILPYDKAGKLYGKVATVFYSLKSANTNPVIDSLAQVLSPMMSKHSSDISLNEDLFKKIKTVYEKRNDSNLDDQQIRVVEKYYQDFVRSGANLSPEDKEKMRAIKKEMSLISLTLGQNLLKETNNFKMVIDNKDDLVGLPEAVINTAAEAAKENDLEGKWLFTTQKPSMLPFLTYSPKRELREKLYRGYFMRGNNNNDNDNKELFDKLVNLRVRQAKLMGYNNFAEYVIEKNMAKTPETVMDFLNKLWEPAIKMAANEVKDMQAIVDAEGGKFKIESWDWWYYAEKVKKAKYNLEESEIQPYFVLDNVRDGMFHVATKLYGITFNKRTDLPVYHSEVETWEVKEADGTHLGIVYFDWHPRSTKRGGAWCGGFRESGWENGKKVDPVVSIVCNFTKPSGDIPALLTWDEVTTMFHEFGHGLHGLFTTGKYSRTAGSVPRDYVELPSQIMENFAAEPEVLKVYAKHYKTGEVIPDELIAKMQKAGTFNQGFATSEYLAASILDMSWETLTEEGKHDVIAFEKAAMDKIGLINEIWPRYRTTYFNHIFSNGYAAGYYVYIWAAVLDADAFNAFKESGDIYNQELAAKFRKHCLSECGNDEGMVQYKKFRGQEPEITPLLERRGLLSK